MKKIQEESLLQKGKMVCKGIVPSEFELYSFVAGSLSTDEVCYLLSLSDKAFIPQLHETINLNEFSAKLAQFAHIFLLCKNQEFVGFNCYYKNEPNNFLYITLLAVSPKFQHSGCGHILMSALREVYRNQNFRNIDLEVRKDNIKAINYYFRENFAIKEDRLNKYLMSHQM